MFTKIKVGYLTRIANGYAELSNYYTEKAIVLISLERFDEAEDCLAKSNKYLEKVVKLTARVLAIA